MVEVIENLYIGDKIDAYRKDTLQNLNIKYIVNCASEVENKFEKDKNSQFKYFTIKADESGKFQMIKYFNSSGRFIKSGRDQKKGVLVHCAYGRNRSATVIVAFLMKYMQMNRLQALDFLSDKRPEMVIQDCNHQQLQQYEEQLKQSNCCHII